MEDPNSAATWAVAGSAITFALTLVLVACHLLPVASTLVVGTRIEGAVIFVLACFWAAIVAIVTNAGNSLGVSDDAGANNQVKNGNLYYFSYVRAAAKRRHICALLYRYPSFLTVSVPFPSSSLPFLLRWAGFFTSIVLLIDYLKSSFGLDVAAYRNRAARLGIWAGLLAASLIVMGSSVRVFSGSACQGSSTTLCRRTKLGISEGVIGIAFAVLIVAMKLMTTSAPFVVEFASSIVLSILNGFGVAYLTSPTGPGSAIGNLYYSSWINFLCAAMLLASCWEQRSAGGASAADTSTKPDETESMDQI